MLSTLTIPLLIFLIRGNVQQMTLTVSGMLLEKIHALFSEDAQQRRVVLHVPVQVRTVYKVMDKGNKHKHAGEVIHHHYHKHGGHVAHVHKHEGNADHKHHHAGSANHKHTHFGKNAHKHHHEGFHVNDHNHQGAYGHDHKHSGVQSHAHAHAGSGHHAHSHLKGNLPSMPSGHHYFDPAHFDLSNHQIHDNSEHIANSIFTSYPSGRASGSSNSLHNMYSRKQNAGGKLRPLFIPSRYLSYAQEYPNEYDNEENNHDNGVNPYFQPNHKQNIYSKDEQDNSSPAKYAKFENEQSEFDTNTETVAKNRNFFTDFDYFSEDKPIETEKYRSRYFAPVDYYENEENTISRPYLNPLYSDRSRLQSTIQPKREYSHELRSNFHYMWPPSMPYEVTENSAMWSFS